MQAYIAMWTERLQIAGIQLKTQLLAQPVGPQATLDTAQDAPRDRQRLSNRLASEREKRGLSTQPISQQHLSQQPLEVFSDQGVDQGAIREGRPFNKGPASLSHSAARSPSRTVPHRAGARRVLVTGASSGIGLRSALSFLQGGDTVALVSRSIDEAKLRALVPANLSDFATWVAADLTTEHECARAVDEAVAALGGHLDVLVNGAGATRLGCGIATTTVEELDWHMDVNLKSAFLMTQRCLPHLEASKGCIVNVSSIASERPIPNCLPFCVSKAALDSLTKCCAVELAHKVGLSPPPAPPGIKTRPRPLPPFPPSRMGPSSR